MTEPDFSPRAHGADAAITAGRRRRAQRQLGSAGAAGAFALAAVLVATHPFSAAGRGSDSLRVAGDPPATAEPTPSAGVASAEPTAEPTASGTPTATDHSLGQSLGSGGNYGNGNGAPSAAPGDSSSPDPTDRVSAKPARSVVAFSAGEDCSTSGVPLNSVQWCGRYAGDASVARGGTARVAVDLCRPSAQGDGSVQFSNEDGAYLEVDSSASQPEWSSQDGRHVANTTETVTVKAGTCLRWTTTWDTRDRDGFRVRPGDYYVSYSFSYSNGSYSSSGGTLTVRP
ncbi:MAG: hypothetical protein QOJ92_2216 [Frankiales bacterium]|nr:hypothetical protein [Frankiales bacterium]